MRFKTFVSKFNTDCDQDLISCSVTCKNFENCRLHITNLF